MDEQIRAALIYADKRRRKDNLAILDTAPLPVLFKIRDAAKIMESAGIRLEVFLPSATIEGIIKRR